MNLSKVDQEFFPLGGGLDLMTPAIALSPGKCFDAQNYEPEISGGYRRIDGYERYDGRASPTAASYWILPINKTGTINVGDTLTGVTSAATCRVLALVGVNVVAGRMVGTFVAGESITVGTVTSAALLNGALRPTDDADYALLAANDQRLNIAVVPGSGRIRGVGIYKDVVYAFRDNAGGTAGDMYKATAGGWVKINFGVEVQFTGAVGQVNVGDTVTQGAVSGVVVAALLRTGTWTSAGVGTLVFASLTGGSFAAGALQVAATTKVTSAGASTAIARLPGGSMEFHNTNFTGSTSTQKMYFVDGVNLCGEFDGTNYIPIRTGMAVDAPTHVIAHKLYLFMSFMGSVQYSSIGTPYSWTVVTGAGEIATGDNVSGFMPQGGSQQSGSALGIYTAGRTHILYGSSAANFLLVTSIWDIGISPGTVQAVGNNTFGLTARGIQMMITTLTYGDFDYASVSHEIQTYMTAKRGLEISSSSLRTKDQYRLYFSDGTGLAVGLTGDKVSGLMPLNYGRPVRCTVTATLATGAEVTYFGSDDGYVYQDNVGTSFDGAAIESWCRLTFNHTKSPRLRKRYRRAVLEGKVTGYSQVNVSYDLGYGNQDVQPSAMLADTVLSGGGGYWDQFVFDQFAWDAQVITAPTIQIEGTEKTISLLFYSSRAQDKSHVLQGIILIYSPRRMER